MNDVVLNTLHNHRTLKRLWVLAFFFIDLGLFIIVWVFYYHYQGIYYEVNYKMKEEKNTIWETGMGRYYLLIHYIF